MSKISVIVLCWNKSHLIQTFLFENWKLYKDREDIEWVVVPNGCTDNTMDILRGFEKSYGSTLKIVESEEALGFGPANNLGAKAATGDVLILVNNDTVPLGDWIAPVVEAVKDDNIVSPQIINFSTGWNTFNDGKLIVPYVNGWLVGMRRETWQTIGGFDEQFVPHDYEDIDLSYTAVRMGYTLDIVAVPIKHLIGQSIDMSRRGPVTMENRERFKVKWQLSD